MTYGSAHDILTRIGIPDQGSLSERIVNHGDRLYLRAEGEPDCADSTVLRDVRCVLADAGYFHGTPAERTRALMQERDDLRKKLNSVCADLEAERAQFAAKAKPVATDAVKLALLVLGDGQAWSDECRAAAVAVIREAFA